MRRLLGHRSRRLLADSSLFFSPLDRWNLSNLGSPIDTSTLLSPYPCSTSLSDVSCFLLPLSFRSYFKSSFYLNSFNWSVKAVRFYPFYTNSRTYSIDLFIYSISVNLYLFSYSFPCCLENRWLARFCARLFIVSGILFLFTYSSPRFSSFRKLEVSLDCYSIKSYISCFIFMMSRLTLTNSPFTTFFKLV